MQLDPVQLRVLGSLIEKEITTPENYPLSLNALLNACNQRSSRDPVLDLTEDQVRQALHVLEELALVTPVRDSRVLKFEHRARTVLNLRRDETAILCLLLLRGPQTPGELRSRADRLYTFDDLGSVQSALDRLTAPPAAEAPAGLEASARPQPDAIRPLVVLLPRQPGAREARYGHLLGSSSHSATEPAAPANLPLHTQNSEAESPLQRIALLESELILLQQKVATLDSTLAAIAQRLHHVENPSPADEIHPKPGS